MDESVYPVERYVCVVPSWVFIYLAAEVKLEVNLWKYSVTFVVYMDNIPVWSNSIERLKNDRQAY